MSSSPWTTPAPNLAWSHHQEFPELKIVGVFAEHGIEVFDLGEGWLPEDGRK